MLRQAKIQARILWNRRFKLRHRKRGYRLLSGSGLEIGAFYLPAKVPKKTSIIYADALTREEAFARFPELQGYPLVQVDHQVDLDQEGLIGIADGQFDFLIINHVLEHVANPIFVIEEMLRVVKSGGHLVITIPDKDFSVDRSRQLTSFEHLLEEYRVGTKEVSDEHYLDFIRGVHPELLQLSPIELQTRVQEIRRRREHAHVWDSRTFKRFFVKACDEVLKIPATLEFESVGQKNRNEYFSVWNKR